MATLIRPIVAASALAVSAGNAWAQAGSERTQATAHHKITVETGPVTSTPIPEQAAAAKEGGGDDPHARHDDGDGYE